MPGNARGETLGGLIVVRPMRRGVGAQTQKGRVVPGIAEKIEHIVVLMLENRSFDCMLGKLYPAGLDFDGLTGEETNPYHPLDGSAPQRIGAWNDPTIRPGTMTIPDPDPGELFGPDMNMQIFGLNGQQTASAPMSGFVDNYVRQIAGNLLYDPRAVMHYFAPEQIPVMSQLAHAFAVSDQWHAPAPCQTWPNRFFVHTGTAGGYVNNAPAHFPYRMPTIFRQLEHAGRRTRIYFHDVPQSIALADLWLTAALRFRAIKEFWEDARSGQLPAYSFIEPRYFTDEALGLMPNDQHPPHDVVYGEQLIAKVYNAVRQSPTWPKTLLVITYDEHGGCFDHVSPPAAVPPDAAPGPDGFAFDRYGVRVPTVVISPYIRAGSIIRSASGPLPPVGPPYPFDHSSIIKTIRECFLPNTAALTPREAAAPSLAPALTLDEPTNDGWAELPIPPHSPSATELAWSRDLPANDLQHSLCRITAHLPGVGTDVLHHIEALGQGFAFDIGQFDHSADAAIFARDRLKTFLGG